MVASFFELIGYGYMSTYALTGGATGIGAAIKESLRAAGHDVIVIDLRDADVAADLSTPAGRDAAIAGIRERAADGLDGLIPCAGLGPHVDDKSLIVKVNYFGAVAVTEGVRDLLEKRRGSVVMISSNSAPMGHDDAYFECLMAGDEAGACARIAAMGNDGQAAYGGGKFALACWLRRNSQNWAQAGVRLNAVAPGFTSTPLTDAGLEDPQFGGLMKDFVDSIPIGRAGLPEDIAAGVRYLLSEDAGFVVGSILFIDGGHDALFRPDQF